MGAEVAIASVAIAALAAGANYYQSERARGEAKDERDDARKREADQKRRTDQQAANRFAALRARALQGAITRPGVLTSPSGAAPSAPPGGRPTLIGG